MGEVRVTFGELEGARANIATASSKVSQELADLQQFVARLVASWDGAAQEAYHVQQRKLETAANDLNQTLNQISIAVGTANDSYQAAERANTQRFSG